MDRSDVPGLPGPDDSCSGMNYQALQEQHDLATVRDQLDNYYDGPELSDDEIRKGILDYADIDGLANILNAIEQGQWP